MEDYFINSKFLNPLKIVCKKCNTLLDTWESHHVWCKFMDNPHGLTWKEGLPNRYSFCFDCHKKLHQEVIIPLLNKIIGTLKYNGSEYQLWKQVIQKDKPRIIEEVIYATLDFVGEKDGDTKTN